MAFKNPSNAIPEIRDRIAAIDDSVLARDFEQATRLMEELNIDFVNALVTQRIWAPIQMAVLIDDMNQKHKGVPRWG